jgi:magnesium transporter
VHGELYQEGVEVIPSTTPRLDRPIWVDLVSPTPDEAAKVGAEYAIHVPSRESLQEVENSSRVRAEGQVLYVNMPLASQDATAGFAPLPLGFILSPELLVTVRYSDVHGFAKVKARVESDPHLCSAAVFVALIDGMVDFAADMLETSSNSLAALSASTFGQNASASAVRHKRMAHALRESLKEVGSAGDRLSRIRESLLGLQRIVGFVSETAAEWLELKTHLKTAQQDLLSLVDFETHLTGKAQFLLDAILGFTNTEQNEIFRVLTIVSVVGIPPTLIAGMYGMNFHNMPELGWRWGYPYGLALIALSTLLPILWFKRRGWW